ncbi:MAG TPA: HAMP domain-containing sensor histidine kinase [Acidimicrobiales bacterium]|nr:HAMP domain-containing sensor histidine kinase [Acidimicrobiales bacterium]
MRRRLTATIVAVVVGALAVAGAGSLLLAAHADRTHFRDRLYSQARVISTNLDTLVFGKANSNRKNVLAIVAEVSRLEGVAIAIVQPDGNISPIQPSAPLLGLFGRSQPLPSGLTSGDLRPSRLLAGQAVSGSRGSLVWVAVPTSISTSVVVPTGLSASRTATLEQRLAQIAPSGNIPIAVVVTGKETGTPGATTWFVLAALAALVVAALVADALGRRITRPLQAVEQAARRIASGDLDQRVEIGVAEYPELASLASSINTMTSSLQEARERERQFFMSISHDLRTPLTSIRGWAEAIADGAATDQQQAARVIGSEARRLERLVQDLLDLARLDSNAFSLHVGPTDVAGVVADTAEGFRPMIDQAGLVLRVTCPDHSVEVAADPDRLAQIVANLVENAYKYASQNIAVAVTDSGGSVVVTVEDDGPGISQGERDRVFERLHQSARSAARQAGSGLGLAIVKELTAAMGGTVDAGPSPAGRGSLLSVTLPATREAEPASYTPGGGV